MCFRYCVNKATHGHEKEFNKYVLTAKAEDMLMDGNPCEGEAGSAFVTQRHFTQKNMETKKKYVQLGKQIVFTPPSKCCSGRFLFREFILACPFLLQMLIH